MILTSLIVFSSGSFLFFGISCFLTPQMKTEFVRYGLGKWRPVIGVLQLLGALGLILGYFYLPVLSIIAAGGLTILMILGFSVRMKINDNAMQSAPSLFLAIINTYIVIMLLKSINVL